MSTIASWLLDVLHLYLQGISGVSREKLAYIQHQTGRAKSRVLRLTAGWTRQRQLDLAEGYDLGSAHRGEPVHMFWDWLFRVEA